MRAAPPGSASTSAPEPAEQPQGRTSKIIKAAGPECSHTDPPGTGDGLQEPVGVGEKGLAKDFGKVTCTLLSFKWITNKDLL